MMTSSSTRVYLLRVARDRRRSERDWHSSLGGKSQHCPVTLPAHLCNLVFHSLAMRLHPGLFALETVQSVMGTARTACARPLMGGPMPRAVHLEPWPAVLSSPHSKDGDICITILQSQNGNTARTLARLSWTERCCICPCAYAPANLIAIPKANPGPRRRREAHLVRGHGPRPPIGIQPKHTEWLGAVADTTPGSGRPVTRGASEACWPNAGSGRGSGGVHPDQCPGCRRGYVDCSECNDHV